ncbi:MAG TPA: histone deacetylase [Candidatus Binatia bacterium]|nr:histone deacetylase [Candidatus Binatia bacterium]
MLRTGIVVDARYQNHYTGRNHPERPARIGTLLSLVEGYQRPGIKRFEPRPATREEIALVHDPAHIGRVAATAEQNYFAFDADTPVSSQSYTTALLATGGLLTLLEATMTREVDNGFALVRPPGHHAERNRAMGFCLFNSAAIGAQYLREKFGLKRVLLMDWDLHHGNGTQHSFYDDPGILYVSTHQYPYYPGTGAAEDTGQGQGEGYTVNLPIPAGWGDVEYQELFQGVVDPICRQFDPEFVLISAGFDAHARDPLGGMEVSEAGFAAMARILLRIARDHAQGRCVAILEGGYDLEGLQKSVVRVLEEMAGDTLTHPLPQIEPRGLLPRVRAVQRRYWELPKD